MEKKGGRCGIFLYLHCSIGWNHAISPYERKISKFDFCESEELHKISKRKDETGMMGKALMEMSHEIRGMVENINGVYGKISLFYILQ